jgi:hypothetical protein
MNPQEIAPYRIEPRRRMSGAGGMPNVWTVYVIVGPDGRALMRADGTRERSWTDPAAAHKAARRIVATTPAR